MLLRLRLRPAVVALLLLICGAAAAQESVPAALFEYPVAPETLTSIDEKSNWIVANFWNPMNFKAKSVDQTSLNHAFMIWATALRWASKDVALKSVNDLLKKIRKNPALIYQFLKAAEENLYSNRADVWIDEVYLQFIDEAVKNKKFPASRRPHYEEQAKRLRNTLVGMPPADFEYTDASGATKRFTAAATDSAARVIVFSPGDCVDCRMWRLKMEMNPIIRAAIAAGKMNILSITISDAMPTEADATAAEPGWEFGYSGDVDEIYDLRIAPAIYIVAPDGSLTGKNLRPDDILWFAEGLLAEETKEEL